ncbi:MAG TPA: YceI family protein [Stellaceae bacterium]|nr:YceI family protein [Stellaceae bacterium]
MKLIRHALILGLATATVASAQVPPPAGKAPAKIEPGTYAVEPNHTRVLFGVDHMGFTTYYGNFTGVSGTLTLNAPKAEGSTLTVTIPTASVSTTNEKLDGELKSADWLDATKYPDMTFKLTGLKQTGAEAAQVTGELTMHGVTKPVTLSVKLHGNGPNVMSKKTTVGFDVTGTLKRSDWGVTKYVPLIGDNVEIIISAAFEKQG